MDGQPSLSKFQGGYADVLKLREGETWIEATLIATDFNNDGCDDYVVQYDYVNYTGFSSCLESCDAGSAEDGQQRAADVRKFTAEQRAQIAYFTQAGPM